MGIFGSEARLSTIAVGFIYCLLKIICVACSTTWKWLREFDIGVFAWGY